MPSDDLHLAACEYSKGFLVEYLDACVFRVIHEGVLTDVRRRKFPPNDAGLNAMTHWINQQGPLVLVTRFPERGSALFTRLIEQSKRRFHAVWAKEYSEIPDVPGDAATTAELIATALRHVRQFDNPRSIHIGCLDTREHPTRLTSRPHILILVSRCMR